jgi:hypothetical protein
MLSDITHVNAHKILAKLIEEGALPPLNTIAGTARSEQHRLQVVVMVSPYDGPLHIHPEVVKRIAEMALDRQEATSAPGVSALAKLTSTHPSPAPSPDPPAQERIRNDVEKAILSVASSVPRPVKVLAKLADYSYCGYFRDAVRRLVDEGLLERVNGGVRRRSSP